MAISTRMSRNPVTPSAQSPSIGLRPSSSRPSSVKNSMAASMSSTTMPTLSMRLTVMMSALASNYQYPTRRTWSPRGARRISRPLAAGGRDTSRAALRLALIFFATRPVIPPAAGGVTGERTRSRRQEVERAPHPAAAAVEDVRVDHGRRDVAVPEQLLDGPDVVAGLEQVGRERVPQGVG